MGELTGFELEEREEGVQFKGIQLRPIYPTIKDKLDFPDDHPHLEHFKFLATVTRVTPKISIPGPSCCHFRVLPEDIAPPEYRDPDVLFADIAATYRKAVRAFYDAGCRYLQMDDIFFAYLCDPKHREARRKLGQGPDWLIDRYAWMMHEAIKDRPSDMVIGMHMCRGNFRSTHAAAGGYDPAADAVFNKTGVDIFLSFSVMSSTAFSIPCFSCRGFTPATTALRPSLKIASASTVAVVVPSPATSLVLLATSRTIWAPMFS